MTTPDLSAVWASWERWLTDELLALGDGEFLIVQAPPIPDQPAPAPPKGVKALLRRQNPPVDAPYVQCLATRDGLIVEAVGPLRAGGYFPWTPGQERELSALGWDLTPATGGNYRNDPLPTAGAGGERWPDPGAAAAAATTVCRTLIGPGQVTDPGMLQVTRG